MITHTDTMDNQISSITNIGRRRKKLLGVAIGLALLIAGTAFARLAELLEKPTPSLIYLSDIENNLTCEDIHKSTDKCAFARSYCGSVQPGCFNYIAAYYCSNSMFVPYALSFWLVSLFMVIGIAAYDFLCPNLNTFSRLVGFPDTLAGVTLLALGNGSPDLFSTFSAMTSGSGSLAVGELLGAAVFITMVVAGSMSIIKPFTVPRSIFLRDIGFFIIAMMLSLWFISDGAIKLSESIAMFALYIVYVFMVVGWHYYHKSRNQFIVQIIDAQENESIRPLTIRGRSWPANYSSIEEGEGSALLAQDNESYGELSHIMREVRRHRFGSHHLMQQRSREGSMPLESELSEHYPAIRPSLLSAVEFSDAIGQLKNQQFLHASSAGSSPNRRLSPTNTSNILEIPEDVIAGQSLSNLDDLEGALSQNQDIIETARFRILETICPSFVNFFQKSWLGMIMSLVTAPFVFLLTMSIPVFETEASNDPALKSQLSAESSVGQCSERSNELNVPRWLLRVQLVAAPLIVFLLHFPSQGTFLGYPAFLVCLTFATVFLVASEIAIPKTLEPDLANQRLRFVSIFGFIMSIIWIAAVADEVVALLRFIGVVYHISETILGLTVFAFGNSLGDLVANVTIARTGNPEMAFSACFGGPLLNILVGIGLSSICIMTRSDAPAHRKEYHIEISSNLVITGTTLLISSILLYIAIPLNGWKMNRTIGFIIIFLWVVSTLLNLIVELRSRS